MTAVSTHVLDTVTGRPAAGIAVELQALSERGCTTLGTGATDTDGRVRELGDGDVGPGLHRLVFATEPHLGSTVFPEVVVTLQLSGEDSLHVPLLLSPYSYSVYRGS